MSKSALVILGTGAIEARTWRDGEATVASVDAGDGVKASREDMAQILEALAAFVRTGQLGPLPAGARELVRE
jgi:hypothetical protein